MNNNFVIVFSQQFIHAVLHYKKNVLISIFWNLKMCLQFDDQSIGRLACWNTRAAPAVIHNNSRDVVSSAHSDLGLRR